MGDFERLLAAYLFLIAIENKGYELTSFDIHAAWIDYCQHHTALAKDEILAAARSQGFAC